MTVSRAAGAPSQFDAGAKQSRSPLSAENQQCPTKQTTGNPYVKIAYENANTYDKV